MTRKVLAVIPARGGSKGLPKKNIIDLAGKPLMAWTIEASLGSKYITKTLVSSDSSEILSIAKQCGAEVIKRPETLASDTVTSESVVRHALDLLQSNREEFDFVVLLQPTSPLRTSLDIDAAFETMLDDNADSIISVFEIDNKILKAFKINSDKYIEGISNNQYPFMRRQDLPKTYMPNGAIYIVDADMLRASGSFITNQTSCYIMSADRSFDIDTKSDLEAVERVIKNQC